MWEVLAALSLRQLFIDYPHALDFFSSLPAGNRNDGQTVQLYFETLTEDQLQDLGLGYEELKTQFSAFMVQMEKLKVKAKTITTVTICGGIDKNGNPENIDLTIRAGEIICIVGPTGSGKSRLLADIEWVAQGDTPTKRQILVNGQVPDMTRRFAVEHKLVAQLSQNMNFIMDLTVREFVGMHAESRMVEQDRDIIQHIVDKANGLAGEPFQPDTPVTALSGGQSRALMIADTAYLSSSPIILIDEIENAGIDRKQALQLLVDKEKIVLMATHDPILALMGDKRLVIKNGGINQIIETTPAERKNLIRLEQIDRQLAGIRELLRQGELINDIPAAIK
ncbi:ATP-binding cassette domain-containing protein [Sporomusa termitida]|uniref:Putative bacteriocin export ABC transporter, lactococcin 972 group n=1 Tax=Sporomusa termitida TaxID=2377 RepID=A0A517DTB8_9FIRM|nr:ATP-binding cassette domain-containing protein [Sporomusa termitida]QDR80604.1 putative bacteriocin export ABC transporter, lactococcin 972 group [Sporomusa termitida]